jgi:hypothetical integral membrane protein (TIGR02206 family)
MFSSGVANPYFDLFKIFDLSHIITLIILFVLLSIIVMNANWIRNHPNEKWIRIGLVIIALSNEIGINVWRIFNGEWDITTSLPFHLCGFAIIFSSYVMLSKNEWFFQRVFLMMFVGATMALLTPSYEGMYGFPHYRFIQFFIAHGMILINTFYILIILNHQKNIRYKHLYLNMVSFIFIALFVSILDFSPIQANYLYLRSVPGEGTAFDLFGPWPMYLVNIFFIGMPLLFHLFYTPFFIKHFLRRRRYLSAYTHQ